jgi:predicted nuclease with TOPRIM domain
MFEAMLESDGQSREGRVGRNVRCSPEWTKQIENTLCVSRRIREARMRIEELLGQYRELEAEVSLLEEDFKDELGKLIKLRKQGLDR